MEEQLSSALLQVKQLEKRCEGAASQEAKAEMYKVRKWVERFHHPHHQLYSTAEHKQLAAISICYSSASVFKVSA